jgi:L-ascorbate metabolism protein UlaG (beta-lactamase superfamily)
MKPSYLIAALIFATMPVHADKSFVVHPNAPACQSLTPAAVGGPMPPAGILTLRWLGTANFELDYQGQVILLDAYYDRGPRMRPIGFAASDVKRANAIFVGHAHFDHMSDAAQVAIQTGAPVIGAATVTETAISLGLPSAQATTVRGGEVMRYRGFTVESILAQHSTLSPEILAAFRNAIQITSGAPSSDVAAAEAAIIKRGTFDPKVITEGTIAYLFTFDNGFRLIYRNSAGPITDAERAVMDRIGGSTDVALVAYMGQYLAERQMAATLPIVQLYHPRLYLPSHHDAIAGTFMDIGLEPLFTAIRDQMPGTSYLSPLYREPVCLDIWNGVRKSREAKSHH